MSNEEETYEYPLSQPDVNIRRHGAPWREWIVECYFQCQRMRQAEDIGLDTDDLKARHLCGNMTEEKDWIWFPGEKKSVVVDIIKAHTTAWISWKEGNIEHTVWWNEKIQVGVDHIDDPRMLVQLMWRKHNNNGEGEEPCCAVHAFLSGRDDFMDFNTPTEEEE